HGGRAGRQLRAQRDEQDGREGRRDHHRSPQPPGHASARCEPHVRPQRADALASLPQGRRDQLRLRRRDHGGRGPHLPRRNPSRTHRRARRLRRIKGASTMTMGPLLIGLYLFVLASFVGFEVINKVPPTLHTPLMSGANAISGITVLGALMAARTAEPSLSNVLGAVAVALAMVNVVGGFLVTDRMLRMFRRKP